MLHLIVDAIHTSKTLRFFYKNEWREVEPHTYGRMGNGKDALCAWQNEGGSGVGFRLFITDSLTNLCTGSAFLSPRSDYHRGDERFTHIYAEL
jgi:hypothetical protein